MADELRLGAEHAAEEMEEELVIDFVKACDAQVDDLINADGFLFCAPENLAALSGEMKEFYDRCYYGVLGRIQGCPYGLAISGGTDGAGAARQAARICQGWRLKPVADPVICINGAQTAEAIAAPKTCDEESKEKCRELGGLVAASVLLGM